MWQHKTQAYGAADSLSRLQSIQSLCKDDVDGHPDAILMIAGLDGRSNVGSGRAIKYLLLGRSGPMLHDPSLPDDDLEECVLLISSSSVSVYTSRAAWPKLRPTLSLWPNLTLYCCSEEAEEDADVMEEYKISSFIDMVKPFKQIGIPLTPKEGSGDGDPFEVEMWPLVQAFGLEDFGDQKGQRGFFTMVHNVVDATPHLSTLYKDLDVQAFRVVKDEMVPRLSQHWSSFTSNLDRLTSEERLSATEEEVGEPILTFFSYGHLRDAGGDPSEGVMRPRVVFGTHTSPSSYSGQTTIGQAGIAGHPAIHLVAEIEDPRYPLRASRTYMLSSGDHCRFDPGKGERLVEEEIATEYDNTDNRLVLQLYRQLVEGVCEAGQKGVTSEKDVKEAVGSALEAARRSSGLAASYSFKDNIKVMIDHLDGSRQVVDNLKSSSSPRYVTLIRASLDNVPSLQHPGQVVGSIVYGDSFFASFSQQQGTGELAEQRFNLTKVAVPTVHAWMATGLETDSAREVERRIGTSSLIAQTQLIAKVGVAMEGVKVHFGSSLSGVVSGVVQAFEGGLAITTPQHGPAVLTFASDVASVQLFDEHDQDTLVIMAIKPEGWSAGGVLSLWDAFERGDGERRVVLSFDVNSPARRLLSREVIPKWKAAIADTEGITFGLCGDDGVGRRDPLDSYPQELHLLWDKILPAAPSKEQVSLFSNKNLVDFHPGNNTPITVITGLPGSGKQIICKSIVEGATVECAWTIVRNDMEHFEPDKIKTSLRRAIDEKSGPTRILFVTAGYVDIASVLQVIASVEGCFISHVACCVNSVNMHNPGESLQLLPHLLDQCTFGFVNSILLTHSQKATEEQLTEARRLLEACNPQAKVLNVKGVVAHTQVVESLLSLNSFWTAEGRRSRELFLPNWRDCKRAVDLPDIASLTLRFKPPFNDERLHKNIRELVDHGEFRQNRIPDKQQVLLVKGKVKLGDGSITNYFDGFPSMTLLSTSSRLKGDSESLERSELTFIGRNLDKADIVKRVLQSAEQPVEFKELRTKESLSPEELETIKRSTLNADLPSGFFYNGSSFVDFEGESYQFHPDMDTFIAEYLEKENQQVEKHNAWVNEVMN